MLGRGELQLAVLVETMRREGFELTVGKPQVVTREIDGKIHEPVERVSVDVPDEYCRRRHPAARPSQGDHARDGQPRDGLGRLDYRVPARGLIGFRTEFLTEDRAGPASSTTCSTGGSRGTASSADRRNGSMVADRGG